MEKVKSFIQNEILSTLKGDIIGGISVAFVALPLALSFGVLSGAGAAAGVYGAICTGILASMFGGTKAQISGPTGAMTVVLVSMAEKYGLEGLVASMIVAGIFEIIMGLLKLGKYIRLIPKPVMVGFTNGIGMLIFINQFKYFEMSPLLCSIAIVMMLILPLINKKMPYAIITVIVGTVVSALWVPMPQEYVVGQIPLVLPTLQIPNFLSMNMVDICQAGLTLALLGAIESLLSALVVDDMTGTKHDSDREILGQGIANTVAACFGFLIGTGAIARSVVNVNAGGRGRMSGIIHALVLILLIAVFGDLAAGIPLAVLGGVLMGTALRMIEYKESYRLARASKEAFVVIAITTVLTVTVDLTFAVAIGTMISALAMLFSVANGYLEEYPIPCSRLQKRIKSFSIQGQMFFLVSESIISSLEVKCKGADIVVINLSHAQVVDITGVITLGKIKDSLAQQGVRTIFTGLPEPAYKKMLALGILDGSEEAINRGDKLEAVEYAQALAHGDELCACQIIHEHIEMENAHRIAEITEEGFLKDESVTN
ncbi:MAG: SulP family inorganic anion transporter [Peptococcaceae bacterium]